MKYILQIIFGKTVLVSGLILLLSQAVNGQHISHRPDYDHSQFVIKLSEAGENRLFRSGKQAFYKGLKVKEFRPLKSRLHNRGKFHSSFLDGIYKVKLEQPQENLLEVLEKISREKGVIYAEPTYYDKMLVVTNDPFANPSSGSQYHLSLIEAYEAWDVTTGSENIRIAILDSGIDPDHEDIGNIAMNEADPVNGIDDDGNGLVDDYMGWDFANSDNDPQADQSDHGMRVSGVATAGTNNGVGVAGVGFNTSVVPLKVFTTETGVSSNAYEAIIYAADQGYEIINLSWGSPGSFSRYRQDIIDYAVIEKGAVIIAAAGNTPEHLDFYPASYDHVLSVAASDENDKKADFSTFSYKVDLVAPGDKIVTTANDDQYTASTGTSFASPQVAAAAALVKNLHPDWSSLQVMEHIRVTTDPIDEISGNEEFVDRLGSGRLNLLKALTVSDSRSVRVTRFSYGNGVGQFAYYGDSVTVEMQLSNYLGAVEDLVLEVNTEHPQVKIVDPVKNLGDYDSLQTGAVSFTFILGDSVENNEELVFQIDFSGNQYSDKQFIEITTSPDRLDFGAGDSYLTTNSEAEFGHESNIITDGIGFRWKGSRLLENMGLMIGMSADTLVDNAFVNTENLVRSEDFTITERLKVYSHPAADLFAAGTLETLPGSNAGLKVSHRYYSWDQEGEKSNIILEFRISNTSSEDYDSLSLGLLANWDINTAVQNSSFWSASDSVVITTDASSSTLSGMAVLSEEFNINYNHIDLKKRSITESTNLTDADKYDQLTAFSTDSLTNTDIAQTLSVLLPQLTSGESVNIAFVLSAASGMDQLIEQIDIARERYTTITLNPRKVNTAYTCSGGDFTLFSDKSAKYSFFSDPLGQNLIISDSLLRLEQVAGDTLIYFQKIEQDGTLGSIQAYQIKTIPTIASFEISADTIFIDQNQKVQFINTSEFTGTTLWDLGNGLFTTEENPVSNYLEEGSYDITLQVESIFGCTDSVTRSLLVAKRNDMPDLITDFEICASQQVSFSANNTTSITVYTDSLLQQPVFTGNVFVRNGLESSAIYYVTNSSGVFESLPVKVSVDIIKPQPVILSAPDTSDLEKEAIRLQVSDPSNDFTVTGWNLAGVSQAAAREVFFDLTGFEEMELTVEVFVTDKNGCQGSGAMTLDLQPAAKPFYPNQTVCRDTQVELDPENAEYFALYRSQNATTPIYRGKKYLIGGFNNDTTLYVSNLDGFRESERLQVDFMIDDFRVQIEDPGSLKLDLTGEAKPVKLVASGEAATYYWSVNSVTVERAASPTLFFDEPGQYEIMLEAFNEKGCRSEDSVVLTVLEENGVVLPVDEDQGHSVYPNPTSGFLNFTRIPELIEIYTSAGQKMISKAGIEERLDISHLPPGIYLVKGFDKGEISFTQRIILIK